MATQSTTTTTRPILIEELAERAGLSGPQAAITMGLVLTLLLGGAVYLDGLRARPFDRYSWPDWWHGVRDELDRPAIIVYILLTYSLVKRSHDRAVEALRGLAVVDDGGFDPLATESSRTSRGGEWLALGIGAAAGLCVFRPWNLPDPLLWTKWYVLCTVTLMYGLLGWIIYVSLVGSQVIARLHRPPLNIDVFDPTPLEPVARLGLGIALAFIGGITLSVLFNPDPKNLLSLEGWIFYGASMLAAVLVFFLTMMSTHRVMAEVKEQKLKLVRRHLADAFEELQHGAAEAKLQDMEALSDSITAWLAYEQRIKKAPTWPYTTDTLRNLLVSTVLPVGARAAKIIVEFITWPAR
jgi:hypothetical protein